MKRTIFLFFSEAQRKRYREGYLWKEWLDKYPQLFDEDDIRIIRTQSIKGYHFYEWLTAIQIYNLTGYHCLVEKYEYNKHKRKRDIINKYIESESFEKIIETKNGSRVQLPDLFVFDPDSQVWFFAEVKGLNDIRREEQDLYFRRIERIIKKPIIYFEYKILTINR